MLRRRLALGAAALGVAVAVALAVVGARGRAARQLEQRVVARLGDAQAALVEARAGSARAE